MLKRLEISWVWGYGGTLDRKVIVIHSGGPEFNPQSPHSVKKPGILERWIPGSLVKPSLLGEM